MTAKIIGVRIMLNALTYIRTTLVTVQLAIQDTTATG